MRPIRYERPVSIADAIAAYASFSDGARYVAGGTTLYDLMKLNIERPTALVDVTFIEGLDAVETAGETLRFGANARMAQVAADPVIRDEYPVLAEALSKAASQQLRNMATVGANLLQRTRCLYFRNGYGGASGGAADYPCNKRVPGSGCAAIGGLDRGQAVLGTSNACTAVSPGDWPVALVAMDARIQLVGPAGERELPVADLYRLPGETPHLEFTLEPGELVVGIVVEKSAAGARSTYHKIRDRESYAFAIASAAVALEMTGARVERARVALGGVATRPWRSEAAEGVLAGRELSDTVALEAGRAAFAEAVPGRANIFKVELGARTVADALLIAAGRGT
ncbi:FAD binding domain-containing protein [Aureimonas mangrovi]|uniref:FAD binding domain-containing protein n=1 Tax=Aureimonas mangrovi TaxID=2758041 RepID=UPI00163DD5B0|nr:xanthine dehydrogenase family protein subunit M [Aureimonas mangrovi]